MNGLVEGGLAGLLMIARLADAVPIEAQVVRETYHLDCGGLVVV